MQEITREAKQEWDRVREIVKRPLAMQDLKGIWHYSNEHLPQRELKHQTPLQALHSWRTERPELLVRKQNNQAAFDS